MTMVRLIFRTSVADPSSEGGRADRAPDMDDALQQLELDPDEVDLGYGLQLVDPGTGEWGLLVHEAAARRVAERSPASGAYSDVRIQTGPPEPSEG